VILLVTSFVIVDGTFFIASLPKIPEGAWVPLAISASLVITALTWLEGRRCLGKALLALQIPLERYIREATPSKGDAKGTMVFLTGNQHGVPFIGSGHRWIRVRADEERVVLLTLVRAARPYQRESERAKIEHPTDRLSLITAYFGYMEQPKIASIIAVCKADGLHLDAPDTSFFYADPKLIRAKDAPMPSWQRHFFAFLVRNSRPLPDDLGIDAGRRVELGVEVAI
jgi:KUP system potassium uptake protein